MSAQAANLVTALRIVLVAPIVWCLLSGRALTACLLLVLAAASDFADGWLARRLGSAGELGRWLDHGADIVLLLCCYAALVAIGRFPAVAPLAIAASFTFYLYDTLRGATPPSSLASRVGHYGGVANYLILMLLLVDLAEVVAVGTTTRQALAGLIVAYSGAAVLARLSGSASAE